MSTQTQVTSRDSGGVLGHASSEWAHRPADESFLTLEDLHAAVEARTLRARELPGVYQALRVEKDPRSESRINLVGQQNRPARLTHWAFGQLAKLVQAPAGFLRELPATLAAQVLNNRLATKGKDAGSGKLLLDVSGETTTVRAFTGANYTRIWDRDITKRLVGLQERGWQPAPETELLSGGKTRGLYASDHDVFAFLVDNDRRIFERDPGGGLSRGFMVANSEVGDKSFWFLTFLYAFICGNHNIWGVQGVGELRIPHRGKADERAFTELEVQLRKYAEASALEDETRILKLRATELGKDKDEVLDKVFAMLGGDLTRKLLGEAWQRAEEHESWYGAPPNTAWALGNGVTEVAREIEHADTRIEVERGAERIWTESF